MRASPALALLIACAEDPKDRGATGVGNPGDMTIRAAAGQDVAFDVAIAPVSALALRGCDGAARGELAVGAELDLLAGAPLALGDLASTEDVCALSLALSGPAEIEGEGTDGGRFSLSLEIEAIEVSSASPLDLGGSDFVLELAEPGWVDPGVLGLEPGGEVSVGSGDPLQDLLADRVARGSALFVDADEDAAVSADERAAGPAASGPGHAQRAGGGRWAMVGDGGRRLISEDGGLSWINDQSDSDPALPEDKLWAVAGGRGRLVAVGAGGRGLVSLDGRSWEEVSIGGADLYGVAYGADRFVAVGASGLRAWSYDGWTWYDASTGEGTELWSIGHGEPGFVAVGPYGIRVFSPDGATWSDEVGGGDNLKGIAWGGDRYAATGYSGRRMVSLDGQNWTDDASDGGDALVDVAWTGGQFVAASGARLLVSADAVNWTEEAVSGPMHLASGEGRLVAAGLADERYVWTEAGGWSQTGGGDGMPLVGVGFLP